jgi:dTDP-4-amino-4,6-dideoxygalactose transaminase
MKFTIGFEKEDSVKLHQYWDEIIANQQWSEGKFTKRFEEKWEEYNGAHSVAFSVGEEQPWRFLNFSI